MAALFGSISPDVARAAVALRRSHPIVPAIEVLDVVLRGRAGRLQDFGSIHPTSAFGQIVAAAFDTGMAPEDWKLVDSAGIAQAAKEVLMQIWRDKVLPDFAAHYGLTS